MSQVDETTREPWILGALPKWGTWLNEEIDQEVIEEGASAMWWTGRTGLWIEAGNNISISIDLRFGNGRHTKEDREMVKFHQVRNVTGGRMTQPNLRAASTVYDPFVVAQVDAILSTHYYNDHIDPFYAVAALKNCDAAVPLIGPRRSVERWLSYGVPKERCQVVKPGDVVNIKDTQIIIVDSFDRAYLITSSEDVRGKCPTDTDEKAVSYIIKTPVGSVYHNGDSHHSTYCAKHGKDYGIDVTLGSHGENSAGNQDKATSVDILRMVEVLNCRVVILFHHDVRTNFRIDPQEINMLYGCREDVLNYRFHPFIWDVGGKCVRPTDQNKRQSHYRGDFEGCFTDEPNVPFRLIL